MNLLEMKGVHSTLSAFLGFSLKMDDIAKHEKRCTNDTGQVKLDNFNCIYLEGEKKKTFHILT